jgi:hypothetical protein
MSHRSRFNIGLGLIREAKHADANSDDIALLEERVAALEDAVSAILAGVEDGTLEQTAQHIRSELSLRQRDK